MNEALVVSGLIGIGLALVSIKFTALERRLNRLSRVGTVRSGTHKPLLDSGRSTTC